MWLKVYGLLYQYLQLLQRMAQLQQLSVASSADRILQVTIEVQQSCLLLQSDLMTLLYRSWSLLGREAEIQIMLRMILSHVLTILVAIDRSSAASESLRDPPTTEWSKKVLFDQHLEIISRTVPTALLTETIDHSIYHLLFSQSHRL